MSILYPREEATTSKVVGVDGIHRAIVGGGAGGVIPATNIKTQEQVLIEQLNRCIGYNDRDIDTIVIRLQKLIYNVKPTDEEQKDFGRLVDSATKRRNIKTMEKQAEEKYQKLRSEMLSLEQDYPHLKDKY